MSRGLSLMRLVPCEPGSAPRVDISHPIALQMYMPTPVVFTTGVADAGNHYIVASGEADLAFRITHMSKALFA